MIPAEIADEMIERYGYPPQDGPPRPEDYLDMTDDELRKATAMCRSAKLKSIRAWPHALSPKQRYCLAAWLAERDLYSPNNQAQRLAPDGERGRHD